MSGFTRITVLGTGVLGSQIAYQTAFSGFEVAVYDINQKALDAARERFAGLAETYLAEVSSATRESVDAAIGRISYFDDLAASAADADLVIEAIPEILDLKRSTWAKLGETAPERTVFATNSSTLLPSQISDASGRADRFLALHFANRVWSANTAEVMGTADTSPETFDAVVAFAEQIGMVPIPIHKEKAGYVLNSLLVPFLNAAAGLAAGGYAEPKDIDNVWRIDTGSPVGPFQIYDIVGLMTPYNILMASNEDDQKLAAWLKENYIDKGRLGMASGHGFYDYS